MDAKHNFPS